MNRFDEMLKVMTREFTSIQHIHEVIFLMQENDHTWTPKSLTDKISETWGEDVHFMVCSGQPFPKELVIDFLLSRQKIIQEQDGTIVLHPSLKLCDGHLTS